MKVCIFDLFSNEYMDSDFLRLVRLRPTMMPVEGVSFRAPWRSMCLLRDYFAPWSTFGGCLSQFRRLRLSSILIANCVFRLRLSLTLYHISWLSGYFEVLGYLQSWRYSLVSVRLILRLRLFTNFRNLLTTSRLPTLPLHSTASELEALFLHYNNL